VLAGGAAVTTILLAFLLRFVLGAVSYAAATPGGLFAPMLVLGAQLGAIVGALCQTAYPAAEVDVTAFFYRCRAGSGYRHCPRCRDDGRLHDAIADAGGMLGGNADTEPAARGANL